MCGCLRGGNRHRTVRNTPVKFVASNAFHHIYSFMSKFNMAHSSFINSSYRSRVVCKSDHISRTACNGRRVPQRNPLSCFHFFFFRFSSILRSSSKQTCKFQLHKYINLLFLAIIPVLRVFLPLFFFLLLRHVALRVRCC